MTAYEVLGIAPSATDAEIKQAYLDLVRIWHPDRFEQDPRLKSKTEEHFKTIQQAYAWVQEHKGHFASSATCSPSSTTPFSDAITAALRQLGEDPRVFVTPNIPADKEQKVRRWFGIDSSDRLLGLIVTGHWFLYQPDGIALTDQKLYWVTKLCEEANKATPMILGGVMEDWSVSYQDFAKVTWNLGQSSFYPSGTAYLWLNE
jgi:hypothetical protein